MSGEIAGRVTPWEMSFNSNSGRFQMDLGINDRGHGYYHLVLWARQPVRSIPYSLSAGANRVDTAGGVACAGWVFRKEA
jgi:hypothetical protein